MHAKIFKYSLKSLRNDTKEATYFGPFTPIYLHLKPTNSRAALCEDFTTGMQVDITNLGPAMSGPNSNRNL